MNFVDNPLANSPLEFCPFAFVAWLAGSLSVEISNSLVPSVVLTL